MNKDTSSKRIDAIAEEAAQWYVNLKSADAGTKKSFAAWLRTSPEHVKEFLAVAALWEALPELSSQPSIEELIALASVDQDVVMISTVASQSTDATVSSRVGRRRKWLDFAAAAALATVVIGGALMFMLAPEDPNRYTTAIGEQTSIPLEDGSIVTLNTQSTLRVALGEDFRDIYLEDGEALFDVAKNPERPFRVITEHAVIQAVGTQFNVLSDSDDITVTVVEGIVDVQSIRDNPGAGIASLPNTDDSSLTVRQPERLTVGQQARVDARSGEVAVFDATIEKAIAWQERRLVFESLSLKDVIDEFNRYNDPPLVIDDKDIESLPINGVFRSNDRESFVQFLAQMQLAKSHTRTDGTIVLRGMTRE